MSRRPVPDPVGPDDESVWDYPRPPRLEPSRLPVRVEFAGLVVARSDRALRVLETSHPPVYYLPRDDVLASALRAGGGESFCEWKGTANYFDVVVGDRRAARAAWSYPDPAPPYAALAGHVAFYPAAMDGCFVGDERARPQPGGFYGGWITTRIRGPFKGGPGTAGW